MVLLAVHICCGAVCDGDITSQFALATLCYATLRCWHMMLHLLINHGFTRMAGLWCFVSVVTGQETRDRGQRTGPGQCPCVDAWAPAR